MAPTMAQTFMIYSKMQDSNGNHYRVSVRDGKVVLVTPNTVDISQLWEKEPDGKGNFMLVCNATGKVVKFYGKGDPLMMVNKPQNVDKSVLWAEGTKNNCGYLHIRAPALVNMVMDAWEDNVYAGSKISIYTRNNPDSDNQLWNFISVDSSGKLSINQD